MDDAQLIDKVAFARARAEIGGQIGRIVGYFREDGIKAVAEITEAMRAKNAAALVRPAHTLKGDARQLGAEPLGELCEVIETIGRDCVEDHDTPDAALEHVIRLQPLFERTLALLERESNPLVERRPHFGAPAAGGFGRRAV